MKPADVGATDWFKYNLHFVLEHFLGYSSFEKIFGAKRKIFNSEIEQRMKVVRGSLLETKPVDEQISIDEFKEQRYEPVSPKVFRGAAIDWPATKKWNLEYFEHQYGDREITVNDNVGLIDRRSPQDFENLKVSQYINLLKNGSLKYLKFSRLIHDDTGLRSDLVLDWLRKFQLPTSWGEVFYLFMGGEGTITPIHDGFACTVFVQITGRKKWTFYETGERVFLNIRPERRSYFHSVADPYNLQDANFPLLRYAKKYEVILEPGDVLWFPPFVWHQVENLTHSIGVAYKFANIPAALMSSKILTTLFFLSTKPFVFHAYFVALFQKREYIFERKQAALDT